MYMQIGIQPQAYAKCGSRFEANWHAASTTLQKFSSCRQICTLSHWADSACPKKKSSQTRELCSYVQKDPTKSSMCAQTHDIQAMIHYPLDPLRAHSVNFTRLWQQKTTPKQTGASWAAQSQVYFMALAKLLKRAAYPLP